MMILATVVVAAAAVVVAKVVMGMMMAVVVVAAAVPVQDLITATKLTATHAAQTRVFHRPVCPLCTRDDRHNNLL